MTDSESDNELRRAYALKAEIEAVKAEYEERIATLQRGLDEMLEAAALRNQDDLDRFGFSRHGNFVLKPKLAPREVDNNKFRQYCVAHEKPELFFTLATIPHANLVKELGQERLITMLQNEKIDTYWKLAKVNVGSLEGIHLPKHEIDMLLKRPVRTGWKIEVDQDAKGEVVCGLIAESVRHKKEAMNEA